MILHVLDERSPQATDRTLAAMSDEIAAGLPGMTHRDQVVLLLGGTAFRDRAEAQGLGEVARVIRVGVPLGSAYLAPTAVLRSLGPMRSVREVHAWSDTALSVAWLFLPARPRVVHVLQWPTASVLRRLMRLMVHAGMDLRAVSPGVCDALRRAGLPEGRLRCVPPTLDRGRLHGSRSPLGDDADTPNGAFTVALLSDPPTRADAAEAATVAGLAEVAAGRPVRLLVHPDQRHFWRAERQVAAVHGPGRLVQVGALDRPWEVLPRADAALMLADPAVLPARWATLARCPVIAPDTPAHRDALQHHGGVTWAAAAQPHRLAHALTQRMAASPVLATA